MPLTGLDVYKLLPKKNCRECGPPTCLAFAMQIAAGKASVDACPHISEDSKKRLLLASEPPMRTVSTGGSGQERQLGGETVVYRHEKKYVNAPPMYIDLGGVDASFAERAKTVAGLRFERVGQIYRVEGIRVKVDSGEDLKAASKKASELGLLLAVTSHDASVFQEQASALGQGRPLIGIAPSADGAMPFIRAAASTGCPVIVECATLDDVSVAHKMAEDRGVKDLIISFSALDAAHQMILASAMRRGSLRQNMRELGHPIISFASGDEPLLLATALTARYSSALVLPMMPREQLLSLATWRHDLYSDPERPIQVESKLYPVGKVSALSPVYITTNFSLTYYSVENEVQASRIPSYILPVDTDGTSVLTAWAAGKFTAEKIAGALLKADADRVSTKRTMVLPGYVPQLARKVSELTGWKVLVGPQEASGIPRFSKSL